MARFGRIRKGRAMQWIIYPTPREIVQMWGISALDFGWLPDMCSCSHEGHLNMS